jgi:hypothetical protein
MPRVEEFMNSLADQDWGWRPFLFLRPRKDQDMDNAVLLKMAVCFGPVIALFVFALRLVLHRPLSLAGIMSVMFGSVAKFIIGDKITVALFWNRRARRLRARSTPQT